VESVSRVAAAILVVVVLATGGVTLASASVRASSAEATNPGVSGAAGPTDGAAAAESSACAAVLADNPEANSSLFQVACNEPTFMSAVQEWGALNFTYSSGGGNGYSDYYYTFSGHVACQNASEGTQCEEEEYWAANETTNLVSGPFYKQYPETCLCGEQSAPSPSQGVALVWILVGAGLVIAALAVVVATPGRSKRRGRSSLGPSVPATPPTEPPSPPS
jgi:hypothetical protein